MNEPMTLEELARMVKVGFDNTATKQDVAGLNHRLGRIEKLLLDEHTRRIERLEDQVQAIKDALAMK